MSIHDLFASEPWSVARLRAPWAPLPAIYGHICAHVDPSTGKLPATYVLPDAARERGGLLDEARSIAGVTRLHADAEARMEARSRELVLSILDLLREASDEHLQRVYELASCQGLLVVIDAVTAEMAAQREQLDGERLGALARYLAAEGGEREAVKLGIALLGLVRTRSDEDETLLMTLGVCDELTLFVAVALSNRAPDEAAVDRSLFALAQRVDGWGRIQLVERLAATNDREVRRWLLREGYRNAVLYQYSACLCARTGELSKVLADSEIDDGMLLSAAELLEALVSAQEGPCEGIDDYEHASRAVGSYLGQIRARRPAELQHLLTIAALAGYLSQDEGWDERAERGWSEAHRARCTAITTEILALPMWRELATAAQASCDRGLADKGEAAANVLRSESSAER